MRGIYKITNTINGKCYIGKSENLGKRIKYHICSLKNGNNKNTHMQNAYDHYGTGTFELEILEELSNTDDINEREKYWIKFYNSNNPEYGYNKTEGGDGGNSYQNVLSQEQIEELKRKASTRILGENNPNYNKHCFTNGERIVYITDEEIEEYLNNGWLPGVPQSTKEKEKISNSGKRNGFYGKKHTKETKEKMSKKRKGNLNWNYNKIIVHHGNQQKYINIDEKDEYLKNGWEIGVCDYVKEKISVQNSGKKKNTINKKAVKYLYKNEIYYGWRNLQSHLKKHGYPKISEITIVKLSKGKHVKGYDDLLNEITIVTNEIENNEKEN